MNRKNHPSNVAVTYNQSHHWNLAQANIGRLRAPLGDPSMAGFADNLAHINQLGWKQPGFWQHITVDGNSTRFYVFDDPNIMMNMTVWESIEALHTFSYRSEHAEFVKRRREWFEPMGGPTMVLWWVPIEHEPTPEEAKERLALLAEHGPTPLAFTFAKSFSTKEMLAFLKQSVY
ncbi:MAG: DUF3291 domain-containing protein [Chloroflexota bacterium]